MRALGLHEDPPVSEPHDACCHLEPPRPLEADVRAGFRATQHSAWELQRGWVRLQLSGRIYKQNSQDDKELKNN